MASADAEPDASCSTVAAEAGSSTSPPVVDPRNLCCNLRIHNLPPGVTEEQLSQLFGAFGVITEVHLVAEDAYGLCTACVTYAQAASAAAALEHFDGKVQLEGAPMELHVHPARDSDCDSMGLPHLEYSWLCFQGFPAGSSFQDILAVFQPFGRVAILVTSSSSSSSSGGGRGNVRMSTQQLAVAAMEGLDGTPVEGGKLQVGTSRWLSGHHRSPGCHCCRHTLVCVGGRGGGGAEFACRPSPPVLPTAQPPGPFGPARTPHN
jgi:RNA recognition motif-containing protein